MNIYYIGGSPCSGKSTIARQLAEAQGLFYFEIDNLLGAYAERGAAMGLAACSRQWKFGPDYTWLRDPQILCRDELQFYREIFDFLWTDLQRISEGKDMIAEGAALLPELMKEKGIPENRYITITPTPEFQVSHYRRREWIPLMLEGCSDKEKAFGNWMGRDMLFAEEVRRQCSILGYRSLITDGGKNSADMAIRLCEYFKLMNYSEPSSKTRCVSSV